MTTCDLHTHSIYSDGTWTPIQLVEEACRLGLSAIALTDHNTVDGLPEFTEAARGREVEAIAGVEFSTDYQGTDVHILGLYIQEKDYSHITRILEDVQRRKDECNARLVENLRAAGYQLDYAAIKAASPNGQINRAHIAAALIRGGYFENSKQCFDAVLNPERGYYQPPKRMTSFEAIRLIKSMGAVAVLAHPLLTLDPQRLHAFLDEAQGCGLDAMETIYVTYDEETTRTAKAIAREYGLLESGGSDFHADHKPGIYMGVGRGNLVVPKTVVDGLRARLAGV